MAGHLHRFLALRVGSARLNGLPAQIQILLASAVQSTDSESMPGKFKTSYL